MNIRACSQVAVDATSLLTFGDEILVCGNPAQALRAKRERNTAAHSTPFFGQNAHGDGSPVADASRRELADGVLSVHTGGGTPEAEVIATRGLTGSHLLAVDAATAEGVGRLELLDALYRHKLERAIACDSLEDASRAASERSDVGIFTEEDDCGTVPGNVGIPPSASARCWSPCRASRQ